MKQLPLGFVHAPGYAAEDFITGESNSAAHGWVMRWPEWPVHALVLTGPAGSGKTHLAHVWAERAGAEIVHATALRPDLPATPRVVEEIDTADEKTLLHLLNAAKENHSWLLLTSACRVGELPFTLPDLTSRLRALPEAHLSPPDDALLTAVLTKAFAERQLQVGEGVIALLLTRIERSLQSALLCVAALDAASLAEGRRITPALARRVLETDS